MALAISAAGCLVPSDPERLYEPYVLGEGTDRGWIGDPTPPGDEPLPEPRSIDEAEAERLRGAAELDLDACFRLAVARSETLRTIGEDMVQNALAAQSALGSLLPSAYLNGTYARQGGQIEFSGISFSPRDSWEWNASFELPLFNGLREFHAWRLARALARSQIERIEIERRILYLSVAQAFVAVQTAEKERVNLEESLRVQEERLREIRARERAGEARRAEVLMTEANAARDRAHLEEARQRLRAAWDLLAYFTGIGEPRPLAPLEVPDAPGDVETLVAGARARRAECRAAREMIAAARRKVDVYWGEHLPSIVARGHYYGRREGILKDIDWDLSIEGSLPLFKGGRIGANVRTARSELRQAEEQARATLRQIELEVRQSWSGSRSAQALLDAARKQREAAEETDRAVRAEYSGGEATNLEVLSAQNLLLQARIGQDTQNLALALARIRLLASCGRIPGEETE
ncbi:MAG: TolC family protein [Planctomycetes bacterium]|nr:TolC family protein [Planctomycetota bacterium]